METTTATTATLHKCTQCNYSHIKITNLRQHMLSHTKPHKCIHCNYGAAKIGQLNLHVLKKHPTTAQAKEIAIKKATKKRTIHKSPAAEPIAKKIKVQSNNGEKKKVYYCDICAKNFAGASGIWYHNKHVHGAETSVVAPVITSVVVPVAAPLAPNPKIAALAPPAVSTSSTAVTSSTSTKLLKIPDANRCCSCSKFKHSKCGNNMCMACCGSNLTIEQKNANKTKVMQMCDYHCNVRIQDRKDGEHLLRALEDDDTAVQKMVRPSMKESSLKFIGETVTLFCMKDFLKNSKFSKKVLEIQMNESRKKKQNALRMAKASARRR